MTDLTPERLQELRRIAEVATPGPWDTTRYNGGLRFDGPLRVYAGTDPEYGEPRPIPASDADTRYIAAFDPPTVLAMLDEIERLREQLRLSTVDQAIAEAEANDARAEIEELRREVEEWKSVASAQAELHDEAEECAERLVEALSELITWIPSADIYRRLGFDPEAPMRALEQAKLALGRGGLSND